MKVQTIMQQIAGGVFMGKVITIAREFGSGGRIIAQSLAEQLKIGFYDKNLNKPGMKKYVEDSHVDKKIARVKLSKTLGMLLEKKQGKM